MTSLSYYIVNSNYLRVADILGASSTPGTTVIGQHKNLNPETLNQQWQMNVKTFNFTTGIYTASLQASNPSLYAVPSSGGVVTGTSEVDWFLEAVTAPFGGATSFRIGEGPEGPFWTAQPNDTQQVQLRSNDNGEDQVWTFIEVVIPRRPSAPPTTWLENELRFSTSCSSCAAPINIWPCYVRLCTCTLLRK
ncbi:hypothetical protein NM688_g3140 [Phlebia brevispora]|uniref:Uncharacterized protein n=1 Tax=Phlebia brevispora TaxID=194682 RepID=A0ACC1T6H6_9APHY|nr:hypothetical protein NM688_g3140 [Phlebia brevispora]